MHVLRGQTVPDALRLFASQELEPGWIRETPEDFEVCERHNGFLCTPRLESDMAHTVESGSRRETGFVAVTLAKRLMKTPDAVAEFADRLRVRLDKISFGGQKDRRAVTGQRLVAEDVDYGLVAALCRPEPFSKRGPSSFYKDPEAVCGALSLSAFVSNVFRITVKRPGWTKEKIKHYVKERLKLLGSASTITYPNAYGPQRFGRRDINHHVGQAFILFGAEAAFKLFITQTSPLERTAITEVRGRLAHCWARAEETARQQGCPVAQVEKEFGRMREVLEPVCTDMQLEIELRLIKAVLSERSFDEAACQLIKDVGLWLGAYQAYWFNQVLAAVTTGALQLRSGAIPMYKDEEMVVNWYKRNGFAEAIPAQIDRRTAKLFPRGVAWRRAYTTVHALKHAATDGAWTARFELEPGSFATSFLDQVFDIREYGGHERPASG